MEKLIETKIHNFVQINRHSIYKWAGVHVFCVRNEVWWNGGENNVILTKNKFCQNYFLFFQQKNNQKIKWVKKWHEKVLEKSQTKQMWWIVVKIAGTLFYSPLPEADRRRRLVVGTLAGTVRGRTAGWPTAGPVWCRTRRDRAAGSSTRPRAGRRWWQSRNVHLRGGEEKENLIRFFFQFFFL